MIARYDIHDLLGVVIDDQRQAEIDAARAARLLAACNGDQRLADAQHFLAMWPGLAGSAYHVALQLGTVLTNRALFDIRPGPVERFRPPRRANRRAHRRKAKRA